MNNQSRDKEVTSADGAVQEEELAASGPTPYNRLGELQSMTGPEIFRFDRSRRRFLQLTGLSLAGLILPTCLWKDAEAQVTPERAPINRAIAWALQDVGAKVVTHVPATGATAIFDAYHQLTGTVPC